MKNLFILSLIALLPSMALADAVEIDGLYYNLVLKAKEAEVVQNPSGYGYSGSINIPATVTYEGIEYNVTSIGDKAFWRCGGITDVIIPNSVTKIGSYAFAEYTWSLTTITIPSSVTWIGGNAFLDCTHLRTVIISDIAAWCSINFGNEKSNPLYYATYLQINEEIVQDLIIPNSVEKISKFAFCNYNSLKSICFPNNLKSIGESAFEKCNGLTSITIPVGITSIEEEVFSQCTNLTEVIIPNSVTSIGDRSFYGCSKITSIDLPNGVTSIGVGAFSGCSNLKKVYLGNSVTYIGQSAFNGCSNLASITIPNSTYVIGNFAFRDCSSLTYVEIGVAVNEIRSLAFANCSGITDVYSYALNVPFTESSAFQDSYIEYATLHVPAEAVDRYKKEDPWNTFKDIVPIEGGIPETPKCATPIIKYIDGKLSFSSETEDVKFVTDITDSDIKKHYDTEINLSVTYNINVYATKPGYDDSDIATATLCWVEAEPITEGVENDIANIKARPVMIQYIGGSFNVSGLSDGDTVTIYTLDGSIIGQSACKDGTARIQSEQKKGSTVIIRFGKQSLKYQIM